MSRDICLEKLGLIKESVKALESNLINRDFDAARAELICTMQDRIDALKVKLMEIE